MKPLLLILFCLTAISFGDKRIDAIDSIGLVNVRTADTIVAYDVKNPVRAIFADIGGIVKLNIKTRRGDTITVVRALNDAMIYPISGIIRVFPLYNGKDSTTCQYYDATGILRRGIGLGF